MDSSNVCRKFFTICLVFTVVNCQHYTYPQPPELKITVASVVHEPFLTRKPQTIDEYEGFIPDLAQKLFDRLGLSYRFKILEKYGYRNNVTGKWNGLIGELVSRESDMVLADLTVNSERLQAVELSVPFMETQLAILMKSPKAKGQSEGSGSEGSNTFFPWLHPMTPWFWVTFLLLSLLLLLLIFFVEKTVSRKISKLQPPPPESLFAAFGTRVFGTPKSIATRVLQVTFWIFVLVCFCAYASNFAADKVLNAIFASGRKPPLPIASAEQLLQHDEITAAILGSGSTFNYFQTSDDPLISKLNARISENATFVESHERGIQRVRNAPFGKFAFIMESPGARYATIKKPCDMSLVPNFFGPKKAYAVAISKDSRRLVPSKINSAILELNEAGVLNDLVDKWFVDQSECGEESGETIDIYRIYNPMTLESLASLFILLTISIFVVFIVAGIETTLNRKTAQTV